MTAGRRRVLAALGAEIAWPGIAVAQPARVPTVAVLFIGDSEDDEPAARPFFEEMARLGWIEGKTVSYDRHSGKGTREYVDTMVGRASPEHQARAAGIELVVNPKAAQALGITLPKALLQQANRVVA